MNRSAGAIALALTLLLAVVSPVRAQATKDLDEPKKTFIHLYGYAEIHVIHDLEQSGPLDSFTDLGSQPLDNAGGQKGRTKFTAQSSRFGFDTSTSTAEGAFNTKVEADFYAYNGSEPGNKRNRLRLRHAYGEYGGWLIGQTWSTFMDLVDLPETVDFNGPIGASIAVRSMHEPCSTKCARLPRPSADTA